MRKLVTCAAAIALAASTAQAQPGKDKNNGGGHSDHPAAQANKGGGKPESGGQGQAKHGPDKQADNRGNRGSEVKVEHGNAKKAGDEGRQVRADRGPAENGKNHQAAQGQGRPEKLDRRDSHPERRVERRDERMERQVDRRDRRDSRDDNVVRRTARIDFGGERGLIDGCPPGLAKKRNGCMPPGLARDRNSDLRRLSFGDSYYRPSWWGYDGIDGRMFYDNGYLYRLGAQNNVLGFVPLLGGALSVGNEWPSYYNPVQVPDYYVDYYNLGPSGSYRYADDVLYRVDPATSAITAVAALLTGDQISVGQPMPRGYDVYNVPYAYRDRYYDTPEANYRYADGYVYQVDPTTQLVAAAIQLLT